MSYELGDSALAIGMLSGCSILKVPLRRRELKDS